MSVVFAGLMCHAPIVIPQVAGAQAPRCRSTTRAMRELAARVVASRPDRLVLVSPHSPRLPDSCAAWTGRHRGDLADFRSPTVRIDLPDAPEVAASLGLPAIPSPDAWPLPPSSDWLDHGAVVPLAFLWDAGWRGPTAILALPGRAALDATRLGRALAALPGRTAVVASGDMSHRLKPGAPAGYDPRAADFDRSFVAGLRADDWGAAVSAEPRSVAAEDVVDSTRIAMAAAGGPQNAEVLSYEGPWGVGYTEAVLFDPAPPLYAVARSAIRAQIAGRRYQPPAGGPGAAGVFVSLHRDGRLRGCMGHVEPRNDRLYEEVADVARLAARQDPRFSPVSADELHDLDIEVSVLQPPEAIAGPAELDPAVYGVIISSGHRGALLLPGLEGIDTVQEQLSVARRKGVIGPAEPVQLQRFTVRKEATP